MFTFTQDIEIERIAPDAGSPTVFTLSAGTSDVTSSVIDLQASNAAAIMVTLGAITASGTFTAYVEQSDASGSGFAALSGATVSINADTDDNKNLVIDLAQPTKRYIRVVCDRGGANAVVDAIHCFKFRKGKPVTQGSTYEAGVLV